MSASISDKSQIALEQVKEQSKESEQLKDTILQVDFSKLKELAEVSSKILFTIIGVCYLAGLLILNLHLQSYGVFQLGFIQLDYVLVGALWLILSIFEYLLIAETVSGVRRSWKKLLQKNDSPVWIGLLIRAVISTALSLPIVVGGNFYVISFFAGNRYDYKDKFTWIAIAGVFFSIIQFKIVVIVFKNFYNLLPIMKATPASVMRASNISGIFIHALPILTALNLYTTLTYPHLMAAYGGGKKQKVILISKPDQITTFSLLGFKVESNERRIGPVEMILEGTDYFIITQPNSTDPINQIKALRIKKDMVDVALYLSTEKNIFQQQK